MEKFTITLDTCTNNEIKQYLTLLNGIIVVNINHKNYLTINVTYNNELITPKIIKMEILLFLRELKIPSIIAFNKHPNFKVNNYQIVKDTVCCEYCLKGFIEDLLDISGIEKVKCNYDSIFTSKTKIIINIDYNPNILNIKDLEQIENKLNL